MDGQAYDMSAECAVALIRALHEQGVAACVGGGWSVDALLGEQTRPHSDLDLWVDAVDLHELFRALSDQGIARILPWPGDRPWNFVLHDGDHRRVDLHLYERLPQGGRHYGPVAEGVTIPVGALDGHGVIAGTQVRCESPQWAVRCHTGYPPRNVDRHDLPLLCTRYGIPLPADFSRAPGPWTSSTARS
jgi:lincosamide nucleotidyltransferase A/C/D/E